MSAPLHAFDRDTAVSPLDGGRFAVAIHRGWWITLGPNGGYLAAILVRALTAAIDDPERSPRSLTVHYLSRAVEGPAVVETSLERVGGTVTFTRARLVQDGRPIAIALAAFAKPRDGLVVSDHHMPEVEPPEAIPPSNPERASTLRAQFDSRPVNDWAKAGPNREAVAGGWMRFVEPRNADPAFIALLADGWPPAIFAKLPPEARRGVPTLDLSVHFRAPVPADASPDDFYLCLFRARTASGGFVEEDGEIWTRDGRLLAQSRQLALLL